jgi:hypothetical protein
MELVDMDSVSMLGGLDLLYIVCLKIHALCCCILVDRLLEPTSLFRGISYSSLGMLLV